MITKDTDSTEKLGKAKDRNKALNAQTEGGGFDVPIARELFKGTSVDCKHFFFGPLILLQTAVLYKNHGH
jgi:hypothetical protein